MGPSMSARLAAKVSGTRRPGVDFGVVLFEGLWKMNRQSCLGPSERSSCWDPTDWGSVCPTWKSTKKDKPA